MERLIYEYMLAIGLKPQSLGYKYIYELIDMYINGTNILPLKQKATAISAKNTTNRNGV